MSLMHNYNVQRSVFELYVFLLFEIKTCFFTFFEATVMTCRERRKIINFKRITGDRWNLSNLYDVAWFHFI